MNENAESFLYAHMLGEPWTVATSRAMELATGDPPSFQSYLQTLEATLGRERIPGPVVDIYQSIYEAMLLPVIATAPACLAVWAFSLALTGARKVQMSKTVPVLDGNLLEYEIPPAKGGRKYRISARMRGNTLQWVEANIEKYRTGFPDSYIRYALMRSGYQWFGKPVASHHGLTHMFRYFFVQVLLYTLGLTESETGNIIGTLDTKNIGHYSDPVVFRK